MFQLLSYIHLTRLVSQIGWDELLKMRSNVFVMEEEYRTQKAQPRCVQAQRQKECSKRRPRPDGYEGHGMMALRCQAVECR
ncbi:hypothetical protein JOM56_012343 [Amanita muscaria]